MASRERVSAKCAGCGTSSQLSAQDLKELFFVCGYCGDENELEDCELFDVDTGARFDRDELGIDPEDD